MKISVIHPTCRPDQALKVRHQWLSASNTPANIRWVFGSSKSDEPLLSDNCDTGDVVAVSNPVPDGYSTAVANYNAAAEAAGGCDIFICAQDDIIAPPSWDVDISNKLQPFMGTPKLLHVGDGFTEGKLMVIMCGTREYLERGPLLCPQYDGWYSDTEFSIRAYDEAGLVVDGRDIKFYHDHPLFTGRESDEAYMRQQNPEAKLRNKLIFIRRNYNAAKQMGLI